MPRCPECGFQFDWSDVARFREHKLSKGELWLAITIAIVPLVGLVVAIPQFLLLLVPAIFVLIAGLQASIEYAVVVPIIGLPSWRRFRAWWEGVIISHAVCHLTWYASGWHFSWLNDLQPWSVVLRLWPVMVLTTAEAFVVQWLVMRARTRRWELGISPGRLVLSCALAKLIAAVPWLLFARMLRQF